MAATEEGSTPTQRSLEPKLGMTPSAMNLAVLGQAFWPHYPLGEGR